MTAGDRITVYVTEFKGRTWPFVMQWKEPRTGRVKSETVRVKTRSKAERQAALKEEELNSSRYGADGSIPWDEFRELVEFDFLSGLKRSTQSSYSAILNQFAMSASPQTLRDANAAALTAHVSRLRSLGRSEDTIKTNLRTLRAVLQWGIDQDLLAELPTFPKIRRVRKSKEMKGRPITPAEFRRMLKATAAVVGKERAASWRRFLIGLWLSGLRLREAMQLGWHKGPHLSIDQQGDRLRLRIPGHQQKSREDQVCPVTPAFAAFLAKTAHADRKGWVFSPAAKSGGRQNNPYDVGRIVSQIGEKAGVVVDETWSEDGTCRQKFASAHDLRRSFGNRWSLRVMPTILQKLMRHAHISTTMKYYVRLEVEETERVLYGEKRPKPPNKAPNKRHAKLSKKRPQRDKK
jgi:integrase